MVCCGADGYHGSSNGLSTYDLQVESSISETRETVLQCCKKEMAQMQIILKGYEDRYFLKVCF